ncbi:ABC transporter permease [Lampropedia aestuarii]|uniref:ABC transporter permease n=1 Tax=Lampropedia aestuarii TaxID=2562762 RepID=A0A4V3YWM2_9BURK|nr:ABC transporter substrate-binding protein [Lampropedia aestuarii]THJ31892.1 ABC transporter permease [Lampropedia aestuarii]
MKLSHTLLAAASSLALLSSLGSVAHAQAQEQYVPALVYRTGQFAPLGVPWADGKLDYYKLVNARGGINGVQIKYEECETGYDTARGVECYERMKGQNGGAPGFETQSTGITFAVSDRAPGDKMPVFTPGYGLSQSVDGEVFEWNFPLLGTYWTAADSIIQDIMKKENGNLKGKKIALVYHDSPYGKEPIPLLQARAKKEGFELILLPVTAPGVEQKSTWLQIRQQRPDYTLLWSAGVMTPTAVREAQATGYPREKIYGVWWAGSDHDVREIGQGAKGYNTVTIHNTAAKGAVHDAIKTELYDKGQGSAASAASLGQLAHTRGMVIAMLQVEAIKAAQEKFGKDKPMTPEQVRWGFENLDLSEADLKELGFEGIVRPIKTSCKNHIGEDWSRIAQWDGSKFEVVSDWYQADQSVVAPLVKEYADRYAKEKNVTPRDCSAVQ